MNTGSHIADGIQPDTGLAQVSTELVVVNPGSFGKNVAPGGSDPGHRYRLPTAGKVGLLRWVEVMPRKRVNNVGNGLNVADTVDLQHWYLTLASPDGTILHDRVPLLLFNMGPLTGQLYNRRRYFDRSNLVDFRQSFLECTRDSMTARVVLRFTYA